MLDPSATTEYFSPGTWQPTYIPAPPDTGSDGDTLTQTYSAGRSYDTNFYGAAWGPDYYTPSTYPAAGPGGEGFLSIHAAVDYLFADPAGNVNDARAQASASLRARGKTLARLDLRSLNRGPYQHVLHHSGWYTLTIDATRRPARGFQLLSPRMAVSWHFYVSLRQPAGQLPLSYTQYRVGGLSLDNRATPGGWTTIAVSVAGPPGAPNDGRAWREVKVQISYNGGLGWKALRLERRGRNWTLRFREPYSGNVSLRSTVVSVHGASTVQTIYDAYGIG